jgi:amidophosphoribosyltransferase
MCGLIGVFGTSDAAQEVFLGLMNLQHRGQDGAGILTVADGDATQFNLQKGSGLIENVFSERSFKTLRGQTSIGHTRYATIGKKDPNLLQPFLDYQAGVGLGHNGNIVNCYELSKELNGEMPKTLTDSDSELILMLLTGYLGDGNWTTEDFFAAVKCVMSKIVGSYAVVGLDKHGGLFGFRDPNGIRPLVLGKKFGLDGKICYALASETVALTYIGYSDIEEIKPGECIYINADKQVRREILKRSAYSPCMFEWVYFARVESEIGDVSVYEARFQLGLNLAEQLKALKIEADVVLPVPETSRAAAIAIAESMDLPYRELLIKNRYVNRTFILDDQFARQQAINRKLFPIAKEIKGKRCLIVDDSIVRGNTAAKIVQMVRQSGAKEIIVVSTCPPIRHPCYYGIDFPSGAELIANNADEKAVAAELGCDRVVYQTIEGLEKALAQKSLCTGCLSNEYPTDLSSRNEFETRRLKDRNDAIKEKVK